jgi:hypothetical protein
VRERHGGPLIGVAFIALVGATFVVGLAVLGRVRQGLGRLVAMIAVVVTMIVRCVGRIILADLGTVPRTGAACRITVSTATALATTAATPLAWLTAFAPLGAGIGFALGPRFLLDFLVDERLPVGERDLVIVGMDFAEGEEAVAIAAIFDEGCLQGRLNARHLGEVDVAAERLARCRLEIEFFYSSPSQYHHPGLLRVGGIDKHLVLFHGL